MGNTQILALPQSSMLSEREDHDADRRSDAGSNTGSTASSSVLRGILANWKGHANLASGVLSATASSQGILARQLNFVTKENSRLAEELTKKTEEAFSLEARISSLEVDFANLREHAEAIEAERDALKAQIQLAEKRIKIALSPQKDLHRALKSSEWQPDSSSARCTICALEFTIFKRRHHCRACLRLVCAKCSSNEIRLGLLDGKPNLKGELGRCCDACKLMM